MIPYGESSSDDDARWITVAHTVFKEARDYRIVIRHEEGGFLRACVQVRSTWRGREMPEEAQGAEEAQEAL